MKAARGQDITADIFQVMTTYSDWKCPACASGTHAVDINLKTRGSRESLASLRDEDFLALYRLPGKIVEQEEQTQGRPSPA